MAKYLYFRASGKYYTEGEGVDLPINGDGYTRDQIRALNNGKLPGLTETSRGVDFFIVVTDDNESFPRLLLPELPFSMRDTPR